MGWEMPMNGMQICEYLWIVFLVVWVIWATRDQTSTTP